jgi:hypothetical protein
LNSRAKEIQLASAWTASDLRSLQDLGLTPPNLRLVHQGTRLTAVAALWDQRVFKQTVIRGYSRKLTLARPWLNFAAAVFGTPSLPSMGSTLAHAFLSPLIVETGRPELLLALVELSLCDAAIRGLAFVTVGCAADDPRLNCLRNQFRRREYWSRLYQVSWNHDETRDSSRRREEAVGDEVSIRPPPHVGGYGPEVALL